ncbi:MAG: hypothetical protein KIT20_12880 [Alphaproteobacteria bacterium]|nr:hypothetical protein [Alphaproteobacteria bacterium]
MDWFHSTHINKIDRKGRISVPADFRAVLAKRGSGRVVLFPALHFRALEGAGEDYLAEINRKLESLPPFAQERDDLIDSILPQVVVLNCDSEGRVLLPQHLIEYAGLGESAAFMGRGQNFHIVNIEELKRRQEEARARARAQRGPGGAG